MAIVAENAVIPRSEFDALTQRFGGDQGRTLVQIAVDATKRTHVYHVPISDFYVGAALLSASGDVYIGMNMEMDDLSDSMHAEQSAIHHAVSEGARLPIQRIGITHSPCGLCRQLMSETFKATELIVDVHESDIVGAALPKLLPTAFTPAGVGKHAIGELAQRGGLSRYGTFAPTPAPAAAVERAAHEACILRSISCWMEAPAAVGLELRNGAVITGVYIESVAHNPTIMPATAAANKLLLKGHALADVVRAVIAYCPSTRIDHLASARRLLGKLCPQLSGGSIHVIREIKQQPARL